MLDRAYIEVLGYSQYFKPFESRFWEDVSCLELLLDIRGFMAAHENHELPNIMQTATKSSAIICSFPNVRPINAAEEGIRLGHYTDYYRFITNKTVRLQPVEGEKKLHVVCFNRTVGETEYIELLHAERKQPCKNGPNYLLGLMEKVPEERMPVELGNKDIVAALPDKTSSVFSDEVGSRCFLCADRFGANRKLNLTSIGRKWDDVWAFLAEDLAL